MPTIQFQTDEATKRQSVEVFQQLGMTMPDAINIFLRQSILHGGLPFEVKVPQYNKATLNALDEMEQSKGKGLCGKEINNALADLKAEEKDE